MVRSLIVSKNFLNAQDAQAQQTLRAALALAESGMLIDVVCGRWDDHPTPAREGLRVIQVPCDWTPSGSSALQKIRRKLYRNYSAINPLSKWTRGAVSAITQLSRENGYTVAISFALPVDSHLPLLLVKRSQPWIAYFSDPWPESALPKPYSDYSIPVLGRLNSLLMDRVVRSCDRAIFPTRQIRDIIVRGRVPDPKSAMIPHFSHPSALPIVRRLAPENATKVIAHIGSLGRERASLSLVQAVGALPADARPTIRFIGPGSELQRSYVEAAGLMGHFEFIEWASPETIPELISDCAALLLLEAPMTSSPFLPSKLADYARFSLPILAITPSGSPVAEMLARTKAGLICSSNPSEISERLRLLNSSSFVYCESKLRDEFSQLSVVTQWLEIIASLTNTSGQERSRSSA